MSIPLKVSKDTHPEDSSQSSNLLFRTKTIPITPSKSGRFSFIETYSANLMPSGKNISWRTPKIIRGKRWYVSYYYKVPGELQHLYPRKWERFRVFEEINIIKTDEYAQLLRDAIEIALTDGYSPFEDQLQELKQKAAGVAQPKEWTIQQALNYFKQEWADRGLEPATLTRYESVADRFNSWLSKAGLQFTPAENITIKHIEAELKYYKKENEWSNRTYNNELDFLSTIFTFLLKKKIVKDNPCTDVDKQKSASKKHRYYDAKLFTKIKEVMLKEDEYLHFVCETIYSTCIRSEKELKSLQVKNIFPETNQVFISAGGSKTNTDRYIPVPSWWMNKVKEKGILNYPGDYYVFGTHREPSVKPFGKERFSKRFRKVREKMGLSGEWTIYGFKHTRVVHMKKDGAKDDEIMSVTGHTDFTSYAKYLRDLGVDVDSAAVEAKTREF